MSLKSLLNLLFPVSCLGCQEPGGYLCGCCEKGLLLPFKQECPGCQQAHEGGKFCVGCSEQKQGSSRWYFDQLITTGKYNTTPLLRVLIKQLKYKFSSELVAVLGKVLIQQFAYFSHQLEDYCFVPVPIDPRRLKDRGFNQTYLLAEVLARAFGKPLIEPITRVQHCKEQASLTRKARLTNLLGMMALKDTFGWKIRSQLEYCSAEALREKTIILIDDVATTGSTLNECSRVLKSAGVRYVCGLTLARA